MPLVRTSKCASPRTTLRETTPESFDSFAARCTRLRLVGVPLPAFDFYAVIAGRDIGDALGKNTDLFAVHEQFCARLFARDFQPAPRLSGKSAKLTRADFPAPILACSSLGS